MAKGLRAKFFASRLYDTSLGSRAEPPRPVPAALAGAMASAMSSAMSGGAADAAGDDTFVWLAALPMEPDGETLAKARARLAAWLAANRGWHAETWRADLIGQRLTHGIARFAGLAAGAPAEFTAVLAGQLRREARHLFRLAPAAFASHDPFQAGLGAIMAARFLPGFERRLGDAVGGLLDQVPQWIYPDGGHRARQPERHLAALTALIQVRDVLADSHFAFPELMQNAIDRMAPMLRAYLLGDGGFALFNGAGEGRPGTIERMLDAGGSKAKAASSAPYTGFHRIHAQRTALVFDVGRPASTPLVAGHAGTLSFEMSVGNHRLIVNCGGGPQAGRNLAEALRATAAHSTLTVADVNSSDLVAGGFGPRAAENVSARRCEQDRNVLVEATHDGYREPFGISHRRLLYLARDGLDLRGEDVLEAETGTGRKFDIRFHLHPDVDASLSAGGRSALLRLPTGRGWRLAISDGTLALE
ncbi:MAG: heparinase II/III family protein, partial [Rhodospirillaceae bacterium]